MNERWIREGDDVDDDQKYGFNYMSQLSSYTDEAISLTAMGKETSDLSGCSQQYSTRARKR
jgi:hypothetical protein